MRNRMPHRSEKRRKSAKMPPPLPPPPAPVTPPPRAGDDLRDAKLETELVNVEVPKEQRTCPACSNAKLRKVGAGKTSTVYEFVPGHFRKLVYCRETLSCSCGDYIITAPAPPRVGEKTQYSPSFVAHVVTAKCADNRAQYNLAKEYQRVGIPMSRSTLNSLFHRAASELSPLVARLFARIRETEVVQADETSIKVQTSTKRAYIWTFVTRGLIGYRFAVDRSGGTPSAVLGDSNGYLVCDAYTGYNKLLSTGNRLRGGCLAHARRKIFDANELPETSDALDVIGEIYAIEREASNAGVVGTPEHAALRTKARTPFAKLLLWARARRREHGPKSLLGRASRYIVNNFRELGLFLRAASVPVDNNAAESSLRRVALGRKNFLFVGNAEAGERLAGLYSLVASCEANGKNPVAYLTDVLLRIAAPRQNIDDLLPDRWTPS